MFVGHLSVALIAKRAAPRASLGWLVAGVMAMDLVWPLLLLAGVERVRIEPGATAFNPLVLEWYPWSHSLVMAVVWGAALAGMARLARVQVGAALLVGLVASHWVLDAVTHVPDLPLWPGRSPHVGLGLWNSVPGTFLVEGTLWAAGIIAYLRLEPRRGRTARAAFWSMVIVSTALWAGGPFGPPPPDAGVLAWFALAVWVIVPWAALSDRVGRPIPGRLSVP